MNNGQLTLSWTGSGDLEWAPEVTGPWTAVTPIPTTLRTRKTSAWLTGAFTAFESLSSLVSIRGLSGKGVMSLSIPPVLWGTLFAR